MNSTSACSFPLNTLVICTHKQHYNPEVEGKISVVNKTKKDRMHHPDRVVSKRDSARIYDYNGSMIYNDCLILLLSPKHHL